MRGNTFRRFLTTEKLAQTTSVNGIYLVRHPSRHYPPSPCLPPVARGWTVPAPPTTASPLGPAICYSCLACHYPPPSLPPHNSRGQDDMESGWTIEDNTFDTINMCMFVGGGRQNVVRRNTFRNCTVRPHGHRLDRFTLPRVSPAI